ncbi:MAG: lysophospholipid acyltransferase family protein [Planctomycetota bacterium]
MLLYDTLRASFKPVQWLCVPTTVLHAERLRLDGPCIIAPTHISHLEPFVVSMVLRRRVHWMSRTEFYDIKPFAWVLNRTGAFPVHRQGYARPAMRHGLRWLEQDQWIGVFPEAGVSRRQFSAMRGGPIKRGAAFLALYAQAPIIPIAVVGTHAMNRVTPWLPFRRAPVYLAIGEPIQPGPLPERLSDKRARRMELAQTLRDTYQRLYAELLELDGVDDRHDLHRHEPDDPARVRIDPHAAAGDASLTASAAAHVGSRPAHAS